MSLVPDFPHPDHRSRHSWREDFSAAWTPFLLSRSWVALWVYLGHWTHPFLQHVEGGYKGVSHWWLNPWTTYDSIHFLEIARAGYKPETVPFQPLFPLLLRIFGPDEVRMTAWGVALNSLCFFISIALLFRLTKTIASPAVARISIWLFAFYPTGAVFTAIYSESVFTVFLFLSWLYARDKKWLGAALFGALASLTRNVGLLITFALLIEWWSHRKSQSESKIHWWSAVPLLLPLCCFLGLQWYFSQLFTDALAGINAQTFYYRRFTLPFIPIVTDLGNIISGRALDAVTILTVASVVAAPVLAWRYRKQLPASDAVYMLGLLLMHLTYARYIPPHTIGWLRYVSTTPSFTTLLAWSCENLSRRPLARWTLITAYLLLCALFSFLFGQKEFTS